MLYLAFVSLLEREGYDPDERDVMGLTPLMKAAARGYVEAIDVCCSVLRQFPDYPKIRKEILEKAMSALRP